MTIRSRVLKFGIQVDDEELDAILAQKQPLRTALTAYGIENERPVVSGVLDLTDSESNIISVNPYAETTIDVLVFPANFGPITLRFLGPLYFVPVGVDVKTGDVLVIEEFDAGFQIVSHVRSDGKIPLSDLFGQNGGVKILYDSGGNPWLALKNIQSGIYSPIALIGTAPNEVPVTVSLP